MEKRNAHDHENKKHPLLYSCGTPQDLCQGSAKGKDVKGHANMGAARSCQRAYIRYFEKENPGGPRLLMGRPQRIRVGKTHRGMRIPIRG